MMTRPPNHQRERPRAVTPTDFVTSIEYDARGQRRQIDYGNGTRTDYEHDPLTFRLRRLHTTNNAGTVVHQDLRYTFDPRPRSARGCPRPCPTLETC